MVLPAVFISSTFVDFAKERDVLERLLPRCALVGCLSARCLPADSSDLRRELCRWIDQSDIIVLLLGARYGSTDTQTELSWTEHEIRYANNCGKKILAYQKEQMLPRSRLDVDMAKHAALKKFIQFIKTGITCNILPLSNTHELLGLVVRDLTTVVVRDLTTKVIEERHRAETYASPGFGSEDSAEIESSAETHHQEMQIISEYALSKARRSQWKRPELYFDSAEVAELVNVADGRELYTILDAMRRKELLTCVNWRGEARWAAVEWSPRPSG